MAKRLNVAILVPVMNEAENVGPLTDLVCEALSGAHITDWEITFVDDGSTDDTVKQIEQLRNQGKPVGYISLSRNFGHQPALEAGLNKVVADVVITMDGDLQHPPAEIPRMIEAYHSGAEIVHMVPEKALRQESKPFYKLFKLISNKHYIPVGSDFRLMSNRVVQVINNIPEQNKVIRVLSTSLGFEQKILSYNQAARAHGKASYTFFSRVNMAVNMVFNYTTFPLKLVFYCGLTIAPISFCFGIGHVITKLILGDQITPGFTDIIAWVLFLSGTILLAIGILGKYLENILIQVNRRPTYIIKDEQPAKHRQEHHEPV